MICTPERRAVGLVSRADVLRAHSQINSGLMFVFVLAFGFRQFTDRVVFGPQDV